MSHSSIILPFELKNKPDLEELSAAENNQKVQTCKHCKGSALKKIEHSSLDNLINLLLPVEVFQCYSCGFKNRFFNENLRSTVTLVLLSLMLAVLAIVLFNNAFSPKQGSPVAEVTKEISTPTVLSIEGPKTNQDERVSLIDSFDLSYRVPPAFSVGASSTVQVSSASESISAIEMDLSNDTDLVVVTSNKEITQGGEHYSVELMRYEDSTELKVKAQSLANHPALDQPLMLMHAQAEQVLFYGIYSSEEQALGMIDRLPDNIEGLIPKVKRVKNLSSKLVLLEQ